MNINKMLKGAVAALTSAAALGALTAPAFAASGTYDLNGKGVDALSVHGGAQRIATIGNAKAKNVILFIGDGMGDSEITVARNYLHGVKHLKRVLYCTPLLLELLQPLVALIPFCSIEITELYVVQLITDLPINSRQILSKLLHFLYNLVLIGI